MKLNAQEKKMGEIYSLLQQDLGYVFGDKESGPNGIKKDFLRKSAAFLRQLGKDLLFKQMNVSTSAGGIAVSGEVSLYGMWGEGNGLFFEITQSRMYSLGLLYREISHIKDYKGGYNQWLPLTVFKDMDYNGLCRALLSLKHEEALGNAA